MYLRQNYFTWMILETRVAYSARFGKRGALEELVCYKLRAPIPHVYQVEVLAP